MNTAYYVDYTYENDWGTIVSDRHYSDTKEEAEAFITSLTARRKVIHLNLITFEERI